MGTKENIIENNKRLGIETIFYNDDLEVLGYKEGKTIYLNENYGDLEKHNKHEVLHFYENTKTFSDIKKAALKLIDKRELERLRNKYYLTYKCLYSEEEINGGILDNEIVIDLIVKNIETSFNIDDCFDDAYNTIINNEKVNYNKARRYLNLNISTKINQSYPKLSKWEKLFAVNYYNNKDRVIPTRKDTKHDDIKNDISNSLKELYDFALDKNNFKIQVEDNPYLEREFEAEVNALEEQRGKYQANIARENKERLMKEMADRFSESLHAQYEHLVFVLTESNYEDAFKYLMLKETLEKEYKKDIKDGEIVTVIKKRELNKSISDHMNLEPKVLDVIYDNIDDYSNFGEIYFAALNVFNNVISESNAINIEGVNTFGKGKWIRFPGKKSDKKEYLYNVKALSSLVKDTPWCTKTLAATQLEGGDFYVFVDHDNKPHLAVRMEGKSIGEVRGINPGQLIEDEYMDVIIEFLTKNKEVENGKKWLDKQLKRLETKKQYEAFLNNEINTDAEIERFVDAMDCSEAFDMFRKIEIDVANNDRIVDCMKNRKNKLAYIDGFLSNVDYREKIKNAKTAEEILELIYKLYGNNRYGIYYSNEWLEEYTSIIENDNTLQILANSFSCNKDDICFLHKDNTVDLTNKYIIGTLNIKPNDISNSKDIKGVLCGSINVSFDKESDFIMPNFEVCLGDFNVRGVDNLITPKLEKIAGRMSVSNVKRIDNDSLKEVRDLYIDDCSYISFNNLGNISNTLWADNNCFLIVNTLTSVPKLRISNIKSADFNLLDSVEEIFDVRSVRKALFPSMEEILGETYIGKSEVNMDKLISIKNNVKLNNVSFKAPNLESIVGNLEINNKMPMKFNNLKEVKGRIKVNKKIFAFPLLPKKKVRN